MDRFNTSVSYVPIALTTMVPNSADFDDRWQRILLAVICICVSFTGIFGNSLILLSVLLSRKLRSPTNVFVVNLSVADLLTCLAILWNVVALLSFEGWPIADWVCSVAAVALYIPTFCSVLTLASIGINRLVIITRPVHIYQKIFSTKVLPVWIAFLWIWPFILTALPPLVGFGELGYNERFHSCSSVSSNKHSDNYDLLVTIAIYPFPLLTIIVAYIWIFIYVKNKAAKLNVPTSPMEDSVTATSPTPLSPNPPSPTANVAAAIPSTSPKSVNVSPTSLKTVNASPTSPESFNIPHLSLTTSNSCPSNQPPASAVPMRILADFDARPNSSIPRLTSSQTESSPHVDPSQSKMHRSGSCPVKKATPSTDEAGGGGGRIKNGVALRSRVRNTINVIKEALPLNHISRRQLAITKNMFYVVVAYLCCLTPFVFCLLIDTDATTRLLPYCSALLFFNSCINPMIYATKHPYFKKIFSHLIRCRWDKIPEPSDTLRALRQRGMCKTT